MFAHFWRIKHVLFIDSQLETHSLRLRRKKETKKHRKEFFAQPHSVCLHLSCIFLFYLSCSGAPLRSFHFHVMWAEAKRALVTNVNVDPPFPCSPKLQQSPQPPPLRLSLHSLCLSALPTTPQSVLARWWTGYLPRLQQHINSFTGTVHRYMSQTWQIHNIMKQKDTVHL